MKTRPVGVALFNADRQNGGQTDMTKLIVTFRNFANAPKNCPNDETSNEPVYFYMPPFFSSLYPRGIIYAYYVDSSAHELRHLQYFFIFSVFNGFSLACHIFSAG